MSVWDQLAEARIQEWLKRSDAEREASAKPVGRVAPLEVLLMNEIDELDAAAAQTEDPREREAFASQAQALLLRLLVLLDQQGANMAAQHFIERRRGRK